MNSVLEHLGVTELQVFSLAVLRGQSGSVWELSSLCLQFIYSEVLEVREAPGSE